MNENRILSTSELMKRFTNIDFEKNDRIVTVWKKVVSRVHVNKFENEDSEKRISIGERLACNTRVVDYNNGILLVETDHSGWIQYLKIYQNNDGFKLSIDSVLLSNFVTLNNNVKNILDIGTGNAPIPLMLSKRTNAKITGIEIQESSYALAVDNVLYNKLESRINIINADAKELNLKNKSYYSL